MEMTVMTEGDLFADLRLSERSEIQSNLLHHEGTLKEIDGQLTQNRNLTSFRSSCIKFCVGKSEHVPQKNPELHEDLAEATLAKRIEFNQFIQQRDTLMAKIVLPKYRIMQRMNAVYQKLAQSPETTRLTLQQEITLFSEFFELQAMHSQLEPLETVEHELTSLHRQIAEEVKAINKADRDTAKVISALLDRRKETTREIGRLRAYLRSKKPTSKPVDAGKARKTISQGGSISLEDLGALLDHGGLSNIEPTKDTPAKKKKKSATTSSKATRGSRNA